MKSILKCGLLLMVIIAIVSCTYSKRDIPTPIVILKSCDTTVHFTSTINPIIQQYCISCHCHGQLASQYDYTTYAGVAAQASLIEGRITLPSSDIHHMPNNGQVLSDTAIQVI